MGSIWEYILLCYVVVATTIALMDPPGNKRRWWLRVPGLGEIRRPTRLWDCLIDVARRQHTLGPLRMEVRGTDLCVVGLGHCEVVRSRIEGQQLIARLKGDIGRMFHDSSPTASRAGT